MAAPQAFKQISEAIQQKLLSEDQGLIKAIHDTLGAPGKEGGSGGICEEIALAIIVPIIVAELTFVGIRIVFRNPFVDQFAQFTRVLMIAYIVIVAQEPQKIIRKALPKLTDGGKELGKKIIESAGKEAGEDDPILYWGEWLGDIRNDEEKCKYHVNFIMKMFASPKLQDFDSNPNMSEQDKEFWKVWGEGDTAEGRLDKIKMMMSKILPDGFATYLRGVVKVEDFIALLMPFMVLSMILTAVTAQMAGYVAPVFTQVAVLVGSRCLLELVLAIGLTVMPLMFFQTFKNIWATHLTFCAGLTLIPCFYYILSGFGFAFSTLAFDAMFPEVADGGGSGGGGVGLAVWFKTLFQTGIRDLLPTFFGFLGKSFTSAGWVIVMMFVAIFEKLYFYVGGTVIVTTFVGGGVGFAAIAHGLAGAWDKAFSNPNLMDKVNEFFTMVQGAVGSAVGQGYGQAMASGTNLIGGFVRGFGTSSR